MNLAGREFHRRGRGLRIQARVERFAAPAH
jgi:hypothetical protein